MKKNILIAILFAILFFELPAQRYGRPSDLKTDEEISKDLEPSSIIAMIITTGIFAFLIYAIAEPQEGPDRED